jgi:hypothetical protein
MVGFLRKVEGAGVDLASSATRLRLKRRTPVEADFH